MSIKRVILKKLFKHRYIGGRHTEIRNVIKGFPSNLLKDAKDEVKDLIRAGYLLAKVSTGEIHVSLNPRMLDEIRKELGQDSRF